MARARCERALPCDGMVALSLIGEEVRLEIYAAPQEREREAVWGVIKKLAVFFQVAAAAKEEVIKFAS